MFLTPTLNSDSNSEGVMSCMDNYIPTYPLRVMYADDREDDGETMAMNWHHAGRFYEQSPTTHFRKQHPQQQPQPQSQSTFANINIEPQIADSWGVNNSWNSPTHSPLRSQSQSSQSNSNQNSPFFVSPHFVDGVKKYISLDDC